MLILSQHFSNRIQEATPEVAHAPRRLASPFDGTHCSLSSQAWRGSKGYPQTVYHNPSRI
jgi:hypothetical protein